MLTNSFFRLARGNALAQLINILFYPIVSRLFTPAEFGIRASFAAVATVLLAVSVLNYEVAIPLPRGDRKALLLAKGASRIAFIFTILILFFIVIIGLFKIPVGGNLGQLLPYGWLLPVIIYFGSMHNIGYHWAIREGEYPLISRVRQFRALVKGIMETAGGFFGIGPIALLAGWMMGKAGGMLWFRRLWKSAAEKHDIGKSARREVKEVLKEYDRHPKFATFSSLAFSFNAFWPVLFFTYFTTLEFTGQYGMAFLVVSLFVTVLVDAFSNVFMGDFAKVINKDKGEARQFFKRFFWLSLMISLVLVGLLSWLGPRILLFYLGSQWGIAAGLVPVLSAIIPASFWYAQSFHVFNTLGKQQQLLVFNVVKGVLLVGAFWGLYSNGWSKEVLVFTFVVILLVVHAVQLGRGYWLMSKD